MSDGQFWNQSAWSNNFYQQYLQQHAQMTQWVQQLHQNVSASTLPTFTNNGPCQCCLNPSTHAAQPLLQSTVRESMISEQCRVSCTYPENTREVDEEETEEYEEVYDDEDDCNSEDEVVFNVDAILSMRASKDVSDDDDEESFELVDSVADELFEYVELNSLGKLERMIGKVNHPDTHGEILNERETRKLLYGDRADGIAGLETSMAINYDHLCDVLQPALWPVLPVLL